MIVIGTPYAMGEEGKVEEGILGRNCERLAGAKVDGVYTTDNDGEFYAIELKEFQHLARPNKSNMKALSFKDPVTDERFMRILLRTDSTLAESPPAVDSEKVVSLYSQYDPAKTRSMLDEAGYRDEDGDGIRAFKNNYRTSHSRLGPGHIPGTD